MPKRSDIKSVLIIGAGPIVIGQACEFDYAGAQACKALREEGIRIILVNSNPATIMTDPAMADATYIEPIHWTVLERIIAIEKPDAILPTMGGQTALNCALDLVREGILEKYKVKMIGATPEAIHKAEDRNLFKQAMEKIGLDMPRAYVVNTLEEALTRQQDLGFPTIIRPSFTMGGSGGGIAYNREEFIEICERGFDLSPTHELLLDESLLGWKEFEMEVVRDRNDNCIIVCSIENFDPMGVHTGDSITVAPAQTLTDKEYQVMRNASLAVLREIGVETGGSNVQFGLNPKTGRMVVIEMNPRVSRSSALASKATGFPIAKVAAKLAIGYTLDELQNDITGGAIPASFEPSIDYVVVKIPRFNFEKFPGTDLRLGTQMKSVGEVMSIGRNFQESLHKAMRSLETGMMGFDSISPLSGPEAESHIQKNLRVPGADRLWVIGDAFRYGMTLEQIHDLTQIDIWFLVQIENLIQAEKTLMEKGFQGLEANYFYQLKRQGFSDARIADLLALPESVVRARRYELNIHPVYKRVDTCAAEFESSAAYLYSTYEEECEALPTNQKKIIVLGGGPNRIGQGIEFDYCCVHAAQALREDGYETIMVNCNPETVSTDYDTSDRLYFEPLTLEDVLEIVRLEKPIGVIVQYGGQTPLKLALELSKNGVPIIGTSPDAIDRAEDRERFQQVVHGLGLRQPENAIARTVEEAVEKSRLLAYPLMVRPSYVLGGRAMEVVYNEAELKHYMLTAVKVSNKSPVLLDRFLEAAIEVDVDAVCDGKAVLIGGIMQHIEQAGVHSGDSACSLPPFSLSPTLQDELRKQTTALALELGVIGLMNVQFAIQNEEIFLLEVNPRASRSVPYVCKATGVSLAKVAARCMVGQSLAEQGKTKEVISQLYAVKMPVFPFAKFQGADPILGPEMKSTGESMGTGANFPEAYGRALMGANMALPKIGKAFLSVRDSDKKDIIRLARSLVEIGFELIATDGTHKTLVEANIPCQHVFKVTQGRPNIVDMIVSGEISYIVNTTEGKQAIADSFSIRRSALQYRVPYTTTLAAAEATVLVLKAEDSLVVRKLQA
jgi:carbamoyl-phosphate synthase large subunit